MTMKTGTNGLITVVIILQPSDEKSALMVQQIQQQMPGIKVIDYGQLHSNKIGNSVRTEIMAAGQTDLHVVFISCHSGIANAIQGKNLLKQINTARKEGQSTHTIFTSICHYSTVPVDDNLRNHVDRIIEKDPNDETHTNVIQFLQQELEQVTSLIAA